MYWMSVVSCFQAVGGRRPASAKDGSPETDINLNVEDTSVDAVRKYLQPAEAAKKRDATSTIVGAAAAAGGGEPTKAEESHF